MNSYKHESMDYEINIDLDRDGLFDDVALNRFQKDYVFYKYGESSPQHRYAHVASRFASNKEHANRMYDYMSKHWLSPATPVLQSHKLRPSGLPASCFLTFVDDTKESLAFSLFENAWLSMSGGGVGQYYGTRAADTKSAGKMPHVSILNKVISGYKQETRRGAIAVYSDITDIEIEQFIDLRNPKQQAGSEAALELHHAVNITDAFMTAVLKNEMVDLVCKKTGRVGKQINARELLMRVIEARCKFGEPYIHFVDTTNRGVPEFQKKLGLGVSQSNLCCVTGDTYAWTNQGRIQVKYLVDRPWVKYLNREGFVLPAVPMSLIEKDAEVLKFTTNNGWGLTVTPEHKMFIDGVGLVQAKDCSVGMVMASPINGQRYDMTIKHIEPAGRQDVYCLNMGTQDSIWVANSFYTGNSEITLPTNKDRTAVCFLSSVNASYYDDWKTDELFFDDVLEFMDNAIQSFIDIVRKDYDAFLETPTIETSRGFALSRALFSLEQERSTGIGMLGYHDYFQSKMIPLESPLAISLTREMFSCVRGGLEKATERLGRERGSCKDAEEATLIKPRRNACLMAIAPNACVVSDTKIRTADGIKSYSDIIKEQGLDEAYIVGLNLVGWHTFDKTLEVENANGGVSKSNKVYYSGKCNVIEIGLSDGSLIKCTSNHKLLSFSYGTTSWSVEWCEAENLKLGQRVLDFKSVQSAAYRCEESYGDYESLFRYHNIVFKNENTQNKYLEVVSLKFGEELPVWDIEVEEDSYYLLENGVISHNSTSILCGNTSPSIEPWNSNVFTQATQAAAYHIVNKRLMKLLQDKFESGNTGKFSKYTTLETFLDKVILSVTVNRGSVQHLGFLDANEKAVFKTAFEHNQTKLIELAAHRQEFIDQAQSINLFYDTKTTPSDQIFSDILYAWSRGVKTLYYQRGMAEEKADKVGVKKRSLTIKDRLKGKGDVFEEDKDAAPVFIPLGESTCLSCEG